MSTICGKERLGQTRLGDPNVTRGGYNKSTEAVKQDQTKQSEALSEPQASHEAVQTLSLASPMLAPYDMGQAKDGTVPKVAQSQRSRNHANPDRQYTSHRASA